MGDASQRDDHPRRRAPGSRTSRLASSWVGDVPIGTPMGKGARRRSVTPSRRLGTTLFRTEVIQCVFKVTVSEGCTA